MGHSGAVLFPLLRLRRDRPILVARTVGLEHDDRDALVAELATIGTRPSLTYRLHHEIARLRMVEAAIRSADLFVCPLTRAADRIVEAGWKTREQTLVAGLGLTPAVLDHVRASDTPWTGRVVWCGTTVERKGWNYFVSGFSQAAATENLSLDVLGTDRAASDVLPEFPAEVRGRVRVLDRMPRDDQFQQMASADVFVSTSLSEGWHLALQEAMALGLLCVSTRAGLLTDVEDWTDYVVPIAPRSADAVRDALVAVARDPQQQRRLGAAAFAQSYTWPAMTRRYVDWIGEARLRGAA
jgi:hypothetical protein